MLFFVPESAATCIAKILFVLNICAVNTVLRGAQLERRDEKMVQCFLEDARSRFVAQTGGRPIGDEVRMVARNQIASHITSGTKSEVRSC